MTAPGGFLDFFILEASDYVEQLDAQLARGAAGGAVPDAQSALRSARALRGSASMAKLPAFAQAAAALERVLRGLRDGTVVYDQALHGAMVAAVDDFKLLLRAARAWSPADDARAGRRAQELSRYAPPEDSRARPLTPTASSSTTFFAAEAANIAAGLELAVARPDDRDGAANVLRRVRALRGVAGIRDVGPLADVMEAAEMVLKPLELGERAIPAEAANVLRAACELLRRLADTLRGGASLDGAAADAATFAAALEAYRSAGGDRQRIVPIAELFFEDGGTHVVSVAPAPPTTPRDRFRLEMVSQGEHLGRMVSDGRSASDVGALDRVRRELQRTLLSLESAAESYSEPAVAEFIEAHADAATILDYLGLNSLEALASVLSNPGERGERLAERLSQLRTGLGVDQGIALAFGEGAAPHDAPAAAPMVKTAPVFESAPVVKPAPAAAPAPVAAPVSAPVSAPAPAPMSARPSAGIPTPTIPPRVVAAPRPAPPAPRRSAQMLADALDAGIGGFSALADTPLMEPTPVPEQPVVPIHALLYRGRAALERAIELRDGMRRSQSGSPPTPEERVALDELFDLLDLALAE